MKTLFRVLAVFFALGIIGSLLDNEFSWLLVAVAIVCFYLGWGHGFDRGKNGLKPIGEDDAIKKERDFQLAEDALKPASDKFTEAQKHALIACLFVVAAADDDIDPLELAYISKVVNVLKYWEFDESKIVTNILNNREMIIEVISRFNDYQQNYLMFCLDGVIKSDFEIKEIELEYADSILVQAGINLEEFEKIVLRR